MMRKPWKRRADRLTNTCQAMVRWGLLTLSLGLFLVGCSRSTGPIQQEVRKPPLSTPSDVQIEAESPIITFPDLPEVPESIEGPSPPIKAELPNE
ncbi:MAG: hypothetical protein JW719_09425 [Pirellulales bacterium]|nr:hypothetical protein [Pirellulales bacterium]